MRYLFLLAAVATLVVVIFTHAASDRFQWLENVDDPTALQWVDAQNARSTTTLENDSRYSALLKEAKAAATTHRIPYPRFRAGTVFNVWQGAGSIRGVLRRTDLESYRGQATSWETIIDFDRLGEIEQRNWVYRSATCLPPDETKCLIGLSEGGRDAVELREFDLTAKTFTEGGFTLPADKQTVAWINATTLLVARNWDVRSITTSGNPFVLKRLRRDEALDAAVEVFRGKRTDVFVAPIDIRDTKTQERRTLIARRLSSSEIAYYLLLGDTAVGLPLPEKATVHGLIGGELIVSVQQDFTWLGKRYLAGSLLACRLDLLPSARCPMRILSVPGRNDAIEQVAITRDRVVAVIYHDLIAELVSFARNADGWSASRLPVPIVGSIDIVSVRAEDNMIFASAYGYENPEALYLGDAATAIFERVQQINSAPSHIVVQRLHAVSKDGTAVPYFVLHKAGTQFDGTNATLLHAYGGFGLISKASYLSIVRKLWIDRGGVYVVANIRGGGEFGPRWHQAGVKMRRQAVFDDLYAVAEDLIARNITTPRKLGIRGSSNGGLLAGIAMTQRPDLWGAVAMHVPLLDLLRFHKLGGASWIGEYGDPDNPSEAAFLRSVSPYHNLKAGIAYPEPFIFTSRADDRVSPAHARKMAARMQDMGLKFLFFESDSGGHATASNQDEYARRYALEFAYFARKLMDCDARQPGCAANVRVANAGGPQ